jgi:chaperonin GroES
MKIRPLADRIVVKLSPAETKTPGGIFIPQKAQEKPVEGRVVAVGPGAHKDGKLHPLALKKGDRVLFGKYSGVEVTVDGEELTILHEADVIGVYE